MNAIKLHRILTVTGSEVHVRAVTWFWYGVGVSQGHASRVESVPGAAGGIYAEV